MEEGCARFFADHVVMNRDDVDAGPPQRFEGSLQFVFQDNEIAVHDGVVVRAGESRPGVNAHFFSDVAAARHFHLPTENGLKHAILRLPFNAWNGL
jgi:hypothetical protein